MRKTEALAIGYRQLAVDFNARPECFTEPGITFTAPALNPGRRFYSTEAPFFSMVTVGNSAVVMAEERLRPALENWAKDAEQAHWLFELPRMIQLAEFLAPYGYELTQTFHLYLPAGPFAPVEAPDGFTLRWLERGDIQAFYPNSAWPNALQEADNPNRPDALALAAMDGGKIIGMAGASIDAPGLWQAGIDVAPGYRGRGLAALLVRGLCHEIQRRGALPFYGTSLSNLHSQNIARNCGFFPAWVEVSAKRKEP